MSQRKPVSVGSKQHAVSVVASWAIDQRLRSKTTERPMRIQSEKRRLRATQVRSLRNELVKSTGRCMVCGASPKERRHRVAELNQLCCHEILNGPLRDKVLDEPSCLIVACWYCNQNQLDSKGEWPLSRQLAVIKAKAPERYDLERVLTLRNPNAMQYVTEDDVDYWVEKDWSVEGERATNDE